MTRDRRGFNYALEPVCSMTAWKINDIASDCARLHGLVDLQQQRVTHLSGILAAARAEVLQQRRTDALFNIDAQRLAHAYMAQVQQQLLTEQARLGVLEQERDASLEHLNTTRKFADSLDRNKESAAAQHDERVLKHGYQQSDDHWLQRRHWRK